MHDTEALTAAFEGRVEALAELLITAKIRCKAQGAKMLACGYVWEDARAFAKATYDAYASAYAAVGTKTDCSCGHELFADADATVRPAAAWQSAASRGRDERLLGLSLIPALCWWACMSSRVLWHTCRRACRPCASCQPALNAACRHG